MLEYKLRSWNGKTSLLLKNKRPVKIRLTSQGSPWEKIRPFVQSARRRRTKAITCIQLYCAARSLRLFKYPAPEFIGIVCSTKITYVTHPFTPWWKHITTEPGCSHARRSARIQPVAQNRHIHGHAVIKVEKVKAIDVLEQAPHMLSESLKHHICATYVLIMIPLSGISFIHACRSSQNASECKGERERSTLSGSGRGRIPGDVQNLRDTRSDQLESSLRPPGLRIITDGSYLPVKGRRTAPRVRRKNRRPCSVKRAPGISVPEQCSR